MEPRRYRPKIRTTPNPRRHDGFEWLYVLSGRMRLVLGDRDLVLGVGEAAEFDTRVPHWSGSNGDRPAEVLSIFGRPVSACSPVRPTQASTRTLDRNPPSLSTDLTPALSRAGRRRHPPPLSPSRQRIYPERVALVGTKWHTPAPRRQLVPRPRLVDRLPLGAGPLPRLILVCAAAGFGKTTLLTQWLGEWQAACGPEPRRVAWLSLDAEDSDPRRFLADVLATIGTAAPDVGAEAAALLHSDSRAAPHVVLGSLINDLDNLDGTTVLALDDYHVVDSAEVHEALTYFLDHLPPNVSIAVTTRADPALPVARLRTRGELVELRAADLRFTLLEATTFLNDLMGLALDIRHVEALESRTEGWAAGLQLAALSLRSRDDPDEFIERFTGSHRFVLDYLVEEVLNGRGERDRGFLLDTSILGQLNGPLCDALTGRDDGQATLEALERANLFVVPLDDTRTWYRYHHLFADTLRARLAAENPEKMQHLHRAAAGWYAAQGRPEPAIAHAVGGLDFELAARLVELALPEASRQRQSRTIRQWQGSLPDDVVRARPVLNVIAAWSRLTDGDVDDADARLQDAEATLESIPVDAQIADDQLRQLPMTIAMYRAAVAQARQDVPGTARQARRILELAGPHDHLAKGAGFGFLGMTFWAKGDLKAAVETFTEGVRSLHAAGNLADELGCTVPLGAMWWARGRPDESRRLHERALEAARRRPVVALPVTGDLHAGLSEPLRERGDLEAAAQQLQAASELGEAASLPENRHRWYVAAAQLRHAEGDLAAAADLLEQAEALYLPGFFPDIRPIPALRARVDIARGRLDLAQDWARRTGVETHDLSYLSEYNQLTLVRLLIVQRRADEVTELLSRLLAAADGTGRAGSVIEILILEALAHRSRGEPDQAMTPLLRALELGVPVGYARLFLDEGPPMADLLREAERRRLAPDLLLRLRGTPGVATLGAPPDHGISERELEVLRLLATELTGPEIANHLFVSINTLRTHTKHIFTKLDVSTRAAAVRRAVDLRLL